MENKLAKSPPDPAQQKLRDAKKAWNKKSREFVDDFLNFKWLLSGRPSKYYKQQSKITSEIPSDPVTIIGVLAGDFQEIAQQANAIVKQQIEWNNTRRKKQPPKTGPITSPAPSASSSNLSDQLSASDNSYFLISEASNPLTRFFTRLLNPGIGSGEAARIKKYRMSLLGSVANANSGLKKMQSAVVSSGPQSIFVASKLMDKVEDDWVFVTSGFQTYKNNMPDGAKDTGGPINSKEIETKLPPVTDNNSQIIDQAKKDLKDIIAYADFDEFSSFIPDYVKKNIEAFALSNYSNEKLANTIISDHLNIIRNVASNYKSNKNTLAEIYKEIKEIGKIAPPDLQTTAQNILGKIKHKISPFDKTSAVRLDIHKLAAETRKKLNDIMNILEKGMDVEELSDLIFKVGEDILKLREMMKGLTSTVKGMGYQNQFMSLLDKNRGIDLDPKQKEQLKKNLEQEQLRKLREMYRR